MKRPNPSLFFFTALILVGMIWSTASTAWAEHDRRQTERIAHLAHRLERSSHEAHHLTHELGYGRTANELTQDFEALERAARRFHERVQIARSPFEVERGFRRLADRYYETRRTFRGFHGSVRIRQAFHRINEPMEGLYLIYTGRNLYRDDPYVTAHRRVTPRGHDRRGVHKPGRRLGGREDHGVRDPDRRGRNDRRGRGTRPRGHRP